MVHRLPKPKDSFSGLCLRGGCRVPGQEVDGTTVSITAPRLAKLSAPQPRERVSLRPSAPRLEHFYPTVDINVVDPSIKSATRIRSSSPRLVSSTIGCVVDDTVASFPTPRPGSLSASQTQRVSLEPSSPRLEHFYPTVDRNVVDPSIKSATWIRSSSSRLVLSTIGRVDDDTVASFPAPRPGSLSAFQTRRVSLGPSSPNARGCVLDGTIASLTAPKADRLPASQARQVFLRPSSSGYRFVVTFHVLNFALGTDASVKVLSPLT